MPSWRDPIELIADTWSGLSYKKAMERLDSRLLPTWVGSHWRRLTAYKLFTAIYQNRARAFLNVEDEVARAKHREYGDAALVVNVVRSAVTGDDISVVIDGMDEKDQEARDRLEWLEGWSVDERAPAKILETERDTAKIGDGVYVVMADPRRKRPALRLFDAGFYLPQLDPNAPEDEFPKVVHVAWQYEVVDDKGQAEQWIRRITWALGPILPATPEGRKQAERLLDGDERDPAGRIVRRYPWSDEPSDQTCYMTDGHWALRALKDGATIDTPVAWGDAARYEVDNVTGAEVRALDLRKDYIPLVHMPNTVAIKEHFGESILLAIAQALDELAAADTDAAAAAALAGLPMVGASGIAAADLEVKAGRVIGLGPDGKLTPLEMSGSLEAVMRYVEFMLDRVTVNSRLTAEAMGRVKASEVPSGLALALSFGPMRSLIEELRLVRAEKYPILLRFVQREAMAQGWLKGPVQPATFAFGSFLPSDKAATIKAVTELYKARLISRHTAVKWLVDEGIVDVDVAAELKACEREDFESALNLYEALGATPAALEEVYKLLGRKLPEPDEPKPPTALITGQPGDGGEPPLDPTTGNPIIPLQPGGGAARQGLPANTGDASA